jgi:hypothetical protein
LPLPTDVTTGVKKGVINIPPGFIFDPIFLSVDAMEIREAIIEVIVNVPNEPFSRASISRSMIGENIFAVFFSNRFLMYSPVHLQKVNALMNDSVDTRHCYK